jgi:glucans biosynthesis protein C
VIVYHAAITYGPIGDWIYFERTNANDPLIKYPLALTVVLLNSFFMGLFLVISGFFTAKALRSKTIQVFLFRRLVSLGIPFLIFILFINPLMFYYKYSTQIHPLTFQNYLPVYFSNPMFGHMWFIELLLIFSLLHTLLNKHIIETIKIIKTQNKLILYFSLFIFLTAASFFIRIYFPIGKNFLHLPVAYLPQYLIFYLSGIFFSQTLRMDSFPFKKTEKYGKITILFIFMLFSIYALCMYNKNDYTLFAGGLNFYSFLFCIWETFFSVSACIFLISLFKNKLDFPVKISSKYFGIYIIHVPVLVSLEILFQYFPLYPLFKFFIIIIMTLLMSLTIIYFYQRILSSVRTFLLR